MGIFPNKNHPFGVSPFSGPIWRCFYFKNSMEVHQPQSAKPRAMPSSQPLRQFEADFLGVHSPVDPQRKCVRGSIWRLCSSLFISMFHCFFVFIVTCGLIIVYHDLIIFNHCLSLLIIAYQFSWVNQGSTR